MKTPALFAFVLCLSALCDIAFSMAQTLHVPGDYSTVQAAIDAAQEGDTVLVAPGTYYENLQLRGRNIVLSSRFFLEQDFSLIAQTIIDGSQPLQPDTASCLLIWKNENSSTVVQGFTFRSGTGSVWLGPAGFGIFREGGGILTEGSSPVIRYNILRDNVLAPPGPGMVSNGGGGIRCGEGAPLIEHNRIEFNRAEGYGGGIVLNYCDNAVIRNNIIAHNYGGKDFSGGGFWATGQGPNTGVALLNNIIAWNESPGGGGQWTGQGGGIWVFAISVQAENNIVWGNKQQSGKQINHSGAALDVQYNCVQDGFAGLGNISDDPLFEDTVCYLLSPGSPCVDAGSPETDMADFSQNNLRALYPAKGALRNDMGVYGGPGRGMALCFDPFDAPRIFSKVMNSPVSTTPGDSRSVNWIDIDGDEDQDLMITNGKEGGENNFLYKNEGNGRFSAITNDPVVQDGAPSDGATWADFDNDGDNDCFVVNWYNQNNLLYLNNGNGTFDQVTGVPPVNDGGYSETASWGDYDGDGWLDLYVTNSGGNLRNSLYRNNTDGTFTKQTSGVAVTDAFYSRCVNWTDYDNDGDLDLFVTNENNQPENLYQNNQGIFTKISGSPLVNSSGKTMSASWADVDNDGDLDVFLANDQGNDALFLQENGSFNAMADSPLNNSGGNSFGSAWGDVDNDADLDLVVTNAFWGSKWRNFLFINDGNGQFERDTQEVVAQDEGWSYGCAMGDFDNDGDLDLAVANCYDKTQTDYLYENHASENDNAWLVVRCTGGNNNKSAIGAKLRVKALIDGEVVWQLREISAQTGYCGQNQLPQHFGLKNAGRVDSLVVEWPSGLKETYTDIYPMQYIHIVENQGITSTPAMPAGVGLQVSPNPFADTLAVRFMLEKAGSVVVSILDVQGRLVRSWSSIRMAAGEQVWDWDGRDSQGAVAPAGQYWVQIKADGKSRTVPVFKSR